jgi:hypothetical protein
MLNEQDIIKRAKWLSAEGISVYPYRHDNNEKTMKANMPEDGKRIYYKPSEIDSLFSDDHLLKGLMAFTSPIYGDQEEYFNVYDVDREDDIERIKKAFGDDLSKCLIEKGNKGLHICFKTDRLTKTSREGVNGFGDILGDGALSFMYPSISHKGEFGNKQYTELQHVEHIGFISSKRLDEIDRAIGFKKENAVQNESLIEPSAWTKKIRETALYPKDFGFDNNFGDGKSPFRKLHGQRCIFNGHGKHKEHGDNGKGRLSLYKDYEGEKYIGFHWDCNSREDSGDCIKAWMILHDCEDYDKARIEVSKLLGIDYKSYIKQGEGGDSNNPNILKDTGMVEKGGKMTFPPELTNTNYNAGILEAQLKKYENWKPIIPNLRELDTIMAIYGSGYAPLRNVAYLGLLGILNPKGIRVGDITTDTRLNFACMLKSGLGKSNYINFLKKTVGSINGTRIENPTSSHIEGYIGKTQMWKRENMTVFMKNAGCLGGNCIILDERRRMIEKPSEDDKELLRLIYLALDSIPNNVIYKRAVDNLEEDNLKYSATSTITIFSQPLKQMPIDTIMEGYGRRILKVFPDIDPERDEQKIVNIRWGLDNSIDNSEKTKNEALTTVINWLIDIKKKEPCLIEKEAVEFMAKTSPIITKIMKLYLDSNDISNLWTQTMPAMLLKMATISCIYKKQGTEVYDIRNSSDIDKDMPDITLQSQRTITLNDAMSGTFNLLTLCPSWFRYYKEMVSGMKTNDIDLITTAYFQTLKERGLNGKEISYEDLLSIGYEIRVKIKKNDKYTSLKLDSIRKTDFQKLKARKIITESNKGTKEHYFSINLDRQSEDIDITNSDCYKFLVNFQKYFKEGDNGETVCLCDSTIPPDLFFNGKLLEELQNREVSTIPPSEQGIKVYFLTPDPYPPIATQQEIDEKFAEQKKKYKKVKEKATTPEASASG